MGDLVSVWAVLSDVFRSLMVRKWMGLEFSSDTARMVIRDRLVAGECGGVYIVGRWLDVFIGLSLDLV